MTDYKRLRRVLKRQPNADVYAFKREYLGELERLSAQGEVDLFYGDESRVSLTPCVPYAWQFGDEKVGMPSAKGGGLNCFALIARDSRCFAETTQKKITAAWVSERLDRLSLSIRRLTIVVLDNARVHTKAVKDRSAVWHERGLFVWFLPTYSPHLNIAETLWRKLKYDLNIAETLWRKLKYEWLQPGDYKDKHTLHYAVWKALNAVGESLKIQFADSKIV